MGRLTADKDFGKGGGLAIGVLHNHRVGGCVLNGASEKERGRVAPQDFWALCETQVHLWMGKAGTHGKASGEPLGFSSGTASEKLCVFGLATATCPSLKNWGHKMKVL